MKERHWLASAALSYEYILLSLLYPTIDRSLTLRLSVKLWLADSPESELGAFKLAPSSTPIPSRRVSSPPSQLHPGVQHPGTTEHMLSQVNFQAR